MQIARRVMERVLREVVFIGAIKQRVLCKEFKSLLYSGIGSQSLTGKKGLPCAIQVAGEDSRDHCSGECP